jgi:hypothetical protein
MGIPTPLPRAQNAIRGQAMEVTRRILNFIFWVALTIGLIWLFAMLLGGGFPVTLSTTEAKIRFDISRMGWESLRPDNGLMTITHEKKDIKEGWGSLQFDYRFDKKRPPGIYTKNYGLEGLMNLNLWMKAKHSCYIGLRLKDKRQELEFLIIKPVGTKWQKYVYLTNDFRLASGYGGRLDTNRFDGYIEFCDMTPRPSAETNTLWVDTVFITR